MQKKSQQEMMEAMTAPVFKTEPKDTTSREGGYAHFEARLEPIGDPTLKVEWLKDGRPMEASTLTLKYWVGPKCISNLMLALDYWNLLTNIHLVPKDEV